MNIQDNNEEFKPNLIKKTDLICSFIRTFYTIWYFIDRAIFWHHAIGENLVGQLDFHTTYFHISCKRLRVKNHTLKVVNTSSLPTDLHAVEVCQEWSSGAATMDWLIFKSGRKRHQMSTSWPTPLTTMFQKVQLQKVLMPI